MPREKIPTPIELLIEVRDALPVGHHEKPGLIRAVELLRSLDAVDVDGRCPTCTSPAPHLHPAMQSEGEVQPCRDPFHDQVTAQNPNPQHWRSAADGE